MDGQRPTRRRFVQVAGSLGVIGLAGCSGGGGGDGDGGSGDGGDDSTATATATETATQTETATDTPTETPAGAVTFTVRVENVAPTDFYGSDTATGGQIWVTPGAYAVHTGDNPIFTAGEPASIGLEALAEAGPPTGFEGQPGLVDELPDRNGVVSAGAYGPGDTVADPNDPTGEVPGAPPIAPGGAFEMDFEAEPGQRLSFASMYVPSNDVFLSPRRGIDPFDGDGSPVDGEVGAPIGLFDAGTELNGQPGVDGTGAPLQAQNGGADAGRTEGVVHPLSAVDDPYDYADPGDVVRVTLAPQ